MVEKALEKDSLKVDVLNFSLNRYNALQYIELLKKVEKQNIPMDYLIANITSNDAQATGKPSMLPWINHPSSKYNWILSKFIKRLIELYYRTKVHPSLFSFSYVEEYINYLESFEARTGTKVLVLLTPSRVQKINDTYYEQVKDYASSRNIEVLFPKQKFDSIRENESINDYFYLGNDTMHLSAKGHAVIDEEIKSYYKQIINK